MMEVQASGASVDTPRAVAGDGKSQSAPTPGIA